MCAGFRSGAGSPAADVGVTIQKVPGSWSARARRPNLASVITAVHTLLYADDADAARAFFRDVLGWPCVDSGGGWLIFKTGPSELGAHPTSQGPGSEWSTTQHHEITLVCDDIVRTIAELEAKGAEFSREVSDDGFGLTTMLKVPGAGDIMVYEPRHPTAHDL